MTEALQKMVEAMAAEIVRQVPRAISRPLADGHMIEANAAFDLEDVARAGLAAVAEEVFDAGFEAGSDWADFTEGKWREVQDPPNRPEAWEACREATLGPKL